MVLIVTILILTVGNILTVHQSPLICDDTIQHVHTISELMECVRCEMCGLCLVCDVYVVNVVFLLCFVLFVAG